MGIQFDGHAKSAGGTEGTLCNYPVRLDTYGCGCQHDCAYCYAKSLLDFRGLWNPKRPKIASTDSIRREVQKLRRGQIVRLGGMTDCFMPMERFAKATKTAIQMLNERRVGYLIVTKSDLVATEEYVDILDPELAHVQISVTSTSDEPNALGERAVAPSRRIAAARALQDAGIDSCIRVSPYIPELVDASVLLDAGVDKCLVEFLRVNGFIKRWLESNGYATSHYTHKVGGYRHLPLWHKKALLERGLMGFKEISVCEDVPYDYEYWRANLNANPDDCCNLRTGDAR